MSELHRADGRRRGRARPRGRARSRRAVRGLPRARRGRRAERVHVGGRRPAARGRRAPTPPLGGVPVAVKDLFCTEGVPSQAGSRILEGYRPPYTATVVAKLADAGAPLLGKTNQDEFAMGSSNENSGFGPVLNPWDRGRVPGGSSGGSAAAVAAGLAPWAIGTDTGGSIRQPAALCGIVGLKPTYGACSRYGMIAFASSLDQAGPLTRDVTDAALLFAQMVGHDRLRLDLARVPRARSRCRRAEDLKGMRLGVPEELTGTEGGVDAGRARAASSATLALAEELGASVEPCRLPHAPARAVGLLPDRAGRGVGEPGALRRRPLRAARRRRRRPDRRCTSRTRAAGLRRRGQAPDHARHVRALERLLRRLLRHRAEGAHEDLRGLPSRVRALRLHRHADQPVDGVRARRRRPTTRSRCT